MQKRPARAPQNNALKLTAPLGAARGDGAVERGASCSPFGEHRRRSLARCSTDAFAQSGRQRRACT